ncbi:hypothetical protein TVAG_564870 [Trichomonas vaginalis G3]|uniref:Uncharacterized protein n=1 Tax=Trichomonas vaginalis (strain ATCC PRA-98 / G3) TaxID=412133 RepID=A2HP46_TRIV3|nr:hypothetical protein TVAGG3_0890900 [Trichomonas vaginalis G3]EAX68820.1 hypothetical protein TVAG_564870 [Trichomonas vaginalis G3]KAI5502715.1 hypothetical protein TVAGG3_0890900 [Trichomonas vaginalis G3]|eukprot:XP_001281750.1 hypothetical protein [Trichomonas vaginalis G3]
MNHLFLRLTSDGSGSSIRSIVLSNPSGIPSPSFRQEELFLPTGKNFPSNRKKFSFQQEKIFLPTGKIFPVVRRKPFKFSKIENFLVELQKKFFLPTGKVFPSNRKSFSFQQEKFFLPTGKVLPSDRTQTNVRRSSS